MWEIVRQWYRTNREALRQILGYFVVPNLPFALARLVFPTNRAYVSIDYLFIGLLAPFLSPASLLWVGLYMLLLVLDGVRSFAGIYYFNMGQALGELGSLIHVSALLTLPKILLLLAFSFLIAKTATRVSRNVTPRIAARALGSTLCFAVLVWVLTPLAKGTSKTDSGQTQTPLVDSSLVEEVRSTYLMVHPPPAPPVESIAGSVVHRLLQQPNHPSGSRIVLIIEEALGLSKNPSITTAVLSPFFDKAVTSKYYMERGSVQFAGPTLAGESRELCGSGGNPEEIQQHPEFAQGCIPMELRNLGYSTTAVHGYTKKLFERENWLPMMGFQKLIFREEFGDRAGVCGESFAGACDTQIATTVRDLLVNAPAQSNQFIYWMTLNSHAPVSAKTASTSTLECSEFAGFTSESGCRTIKVQYETNQAIARILTTPDLPPTTFIIVGDHAPPLPTLEDRDDWSQSRVPWVVLLPKYASARK